MKRTSTYKRDIINFIGTCAIIVLLNYVCSFLFGRFDMTEDQRFSLSKSTIKTLESDKLLSDRIYFRVYLDGDLPADLKKVRNAIQEKLDEFIVYAGNKIQYEFIDPNGDADEDFNFEFQKNLYAEGLRPTNVSVIENNGYQEKVFWPGASIEFEGATVDYIQFVNKTRIVDGEDTRGLADGVINTLEYKLVDAIRRVTTKEKKKVGFLMGHGELNTYQTYDARKGLERHYKVEDVEIGGKINALDEFDGLIIAQPKVRFNEKDKFVIDQFVMNGGRVMWFLDPMNPHLDSLYSAGLTYALPFDLNIEKDMIYKYGVRLNTDILLDKDCAPIFVPFTNTFNNWVFSPKLKRAKHFITSNLDPIRSNYVSSADVVNESDTAVRKTVLLSTSSNSIQFKSPARISFELAVDTTKWPNLNNPNQGNFPVAVLLEGRFSSPFEHIVADAFLNSPDFKTKFKSDYNKMLIASDGDIIRNFVDRKTDGNKVLPAPIPLDVEYNLPSEQVGKRYNNLDFVLNTMDYLFGDESLLELRSKTVDFRGLDNEKINAERTKWSFINLFLPILLILILALSQFVLRRKKYVKQEGK